MITVIGSWEANWMDAERTERRLWKQTIQAYKVDRWIMVPRSGSEFSSPEQCDTMEDAIASTNGSLVFLIPEKSVRNRTPLYLHNYSHPENAVYIFGSSPDSLARYITNDSHVVTIDTPSRTDLFAIVSLGIVLSHRGLSDGN